VISTVLTLLIGYPIAYGMARAPAQYPPDAADAGHPAVLDLFLIRVYAWIASSSPKAAQPAAARLGIIDSR
jgi:putrescine transport system permease protein